mgnify:CR=1 FL=1
MPDGAAWRHWCQRDGVAQLQDHAAFPPRASLHVATTPQPLIRTHTRPVATTPAGTDKVPYKSATDHTCQYFPPPGTRPRKQEEGKCAAVPQPRPLHTEATQVANPPRRILACDGDGGRRVVPPPSCAMAHIAYEVMRVIATLACSCLRCLARTASQVRRTRQDRRLGAAQRQP